MAPSRPWVTSANLRPCTVARVMPTEVEKMIHEGRGLRDYSKIGWEKDRM